VIGLGLEEGIAKQKTLDEEIFALQRKIYRWLEEMFFDVHEPRSLVITFYARQERRIYAWDFAERLARRFLGYKAKRSEGKSWEDAQKALGIIR
jgi:hypothetical protein